MRMIKNQPQKSRQNQPLMAENEASHFNTVVGAGVKPVNGGALAGANLQ